MKSTTESTVKTETRALADKIREFLTDRAISQNTLAEQAGISPGHLSKIMNGKRSWTFDAISWLAGALKMTSAELTKGTDQEELVAQVEGTPSREEIEQLQQRFAERQTKIQELEAELAAERAARTSLQRQIKKALKTRDSLISQLEDAQSSERRVRVELKKGIEDFQKLRDERDTLKTDLTVAREQNTELRQQLKQANEAASRNFFFGGAIGAGVRHVLGGD